MLTLDYRLKKQKDFELVFKLGKRVYSKTLTLIYLPSSELKVGYAVSKKHGGSVVRNRIKRLLRESFRSFAKNISKNFFFVIIPNIPKEKLDFNKQFGCLESDKKAIKKDNEKKNLKKVCKKVSYNLGELKSDMLYLLRKAEILD